MNNMLMRVYETMSCSLGEITRDPLTHCPGEKTPPHPHPHHAHTRETQFPLFLPENKTRTMVEPTSKFTKSGSSAASVRVYLHPCVNGRTGACSLPTRPPRPPSETRIKNTTDLKAPEEKMPRSEAAAASDLRLRLRSEAAAV